MTCFTPYTIRIFSSNTDLNAISIATVVEQLVRAFTSHVEGWVFKSQSPQT